MLCMLGCMCTGLCNFAKIAGFNSTCNFVKKYYLRMLSQTLSGINISGTAFKTSLKRVYFKRGCNPCSAFYKMLHLFGVLLSVK